MITSFDRFLSEFKKKHPKWFGAYGDPNNPPPVAEKDHKAAAAGDDSGDAEMVEDKENS